MAAERQQSKMQHQEMKLLISAAEFATKSTPIDYQLSLELARAARNVLVAERDVFKSRIKETHQLLKALHDTVDDAHSNVNDANLQIGSLLNMLDKQGVPFEVTRCYKPILHFKSDSDSDSDDSNVVAADPGSDPDSDPDSNDLNTAATDPDTWAPDSPSSIVSGPVKIGVSDLNV